MSLKNEKFQNLLKCKSYIKIRTLLLIESAVLTYFASAEAFLPSIFSYKIVGSKTKHLG